MQGVQAHSQNFDLSKLRENLGKIHESLGKNGAQCCLIKKNGA